MQIMKKLTDVSNIWDTCTSTVHSSCVANCSAQNIVLISPIDFGDIEAALIAELDHQVSTCI